MPWVRKIGSSWERFIRFFPLHAAPSPPIKLPSCHKTSSRSWELLNDSHVTITASRGAAGGVSVASFSAAAQMSMNRDKKIAYCTSWSHEVHSVVFLEHEATTDSK